MRGIWELKEGDVLPGIYQLSIKLPDLVMVVPLTGLPFVGRDFDPNDEVTKLLHHWIALRQINVASAAGIRECGKFIGECLPF